MQFCHLDEMLSLYSQLILNLYSKPGSNLWQTLRPVGVFVQIVFFKTNESNRSVVVLCCMQCCPLPLLTQMLNVD